MKSNLHLKIQGVRGGSPSWNQNKGMCAMFIDNHDNGSSNFIAADAFVGSGKTYERRKQCLINIKIQGEIVFSGTIQQLAEKLKYK